MSKNSYSLDKGFLFPYSHAPIIEALDDASAGILLKACIKRQKDGIPFPSVGDPVLNVALLSFEPIIQNRLFGQKGGNKNALQTAENDSEMVGGIVGGIVGGTVGGTVHKLSKDKLSKDKLSKDNNTTPSISPSARGKSCSTKANDVELEKSFDLFWIEYPRKQDKKNALKAWMKIKPDEALTDHIIAAVKLQKRGENWQRDNGQYIPLPATWLNGARWEDETPNTQHRSSVEIKPNAYDFLFNS